MTTEPRKKRLIEVAFPPEEVSADSRKDPYQGSPHPQTLHRWWARRPLAAAGEGVPALGQRHPHRVRSLRGRARVCGQDAKGKLHRSGRAASSLSAGSAPQTSLHDAGRPRCRSGV